MTDLYRGRDPRDIPTYTIPDAARYLRIPAGTVRSWTVGRSYPVTEGKRFFEPLIAVPQQTPRLLSFTNLIEIHVLRAIRKHHKIQLDKVRTALDFLEAQLNVTHPLAHEEFRTDGISLFIDRYGTLINASAQGQTQLKAVLTQHLERIEPDDSGLAIKLYPFTRSDEAHNPRIVVIDPRIAFGRLVIDGTGIPTSIIAERYKAGDSLQDLTEDYDCDLSQIEEAIRCEIPLAA
ncbi:DUF433 domain-containing protein [Halomicronema sp. CCY15110]|uniref:DUF433 domain-containing protein n=1 Tax=Halomicronema sp. CCY15110 TaxID=2767773 RepID=UPI001951FB3E|nr:DUF433 domain-containing protein [Halomicronema sp. CCY15110]